ncbi:LytR C-terminal domain-containing protein [Euzebya sp.]|uniref:LytR C-terminal domain-containing protein n=1 Tax=Euzebya sp. TaxID=1971409 RepID=UPI003513492B
MDSYEQDDYGPAPTQSSIAAPLIRALLFAALAFLIYWIVFGSMGDGEEVTALDGTETPQDTTPLVTGSEIPLETLPTGPVTEAPGLPGGTEGPSAAPAGTETPGAAGGQVGAGTSVQVIAGANTTAEQFDAAVQALTELGYDVTESGVSPNPYPQTTVFPSPGQDAAAQALVSADERFTTVGENPGTLTEQIQIHVLVGEDWPS